MNPEVEMEAQEAPEVLVEPQPTEISVEARTVQLLKDSVLIQMENGMEKMVSYETFIDLLSEATRTITSSRAMAGFNLPSNVFYFANSHNEINISSYYQSSKRPLVYGTSKMEVIAPNIIISHILSNERSKGEKAWVVKDTRYFCTDKTVGNLDRNFIFSKDYSKSIYMLPMSNTYDDCRMCYGDNQMPRNMVDNNLRSLDWYYQYLWETPFNNDLGVKAINEAGDVKGWYYLLRDEAKKDDPKFPYNKLRHYNG